QLIQHQITQGDIPQISSNSSWGKINTHEIPVCDNNKEITFLADSSLDSLQLEDNIEIIQNPWNKEEDVVCIETFQTDSSVAMDNTGNMFDCFPSGFESISSQNSTKHSNTINTNIHTLQSNEYSNLLHRDASSFKIHNEHTLHIAECNDNDLAESRDIHADIPRDNVVDSSASKKRGTKRGAEWMVSVDKKGAVLAYEQEHNIIPASNTHIPTNPNTQELHETGHTSINTVDITTSSCNILHELSSEERKEVMRTAGLSSYCYFTLIFSDGSSQLREISRTKNSSEEIEGVMIALQTGESTDNFKYVFLSFGESDNEYRVFCRGLLHKLFSSELMCCVCFDAQELLISIIGHLCISHKDVYSGWSVKDVKVAGWLLDSDHPPQSFLQLKERSVSTEHITTHTSSRANAYTRAITDIYELVNVYSNIRSALVKEDMFDLFYELESRVVPILSVMEGEGLGVDIDILTGMRDSLSKQIDCIEREAHSIAQRPFQLTSPAQWLSSKADYCN
ncbi:DNA polymerase nu-like, partial [Oopsacas minuta]